MRFGRFTVDLYDREHHVAYEADAKYWHDKYEAREPGVHHRRDAYLKDRYGLTTVRYDDKQIKAMRRTRKDVAA